MKDIIAELWDRNLLDEAGMLEALAKEAKKALKKGEKGGQYYVTKTGKRVYVRRESSKPPMSKSDMMQFAQDNALDMLNKVKKVLHSKGSPPMNLAKERQLEADLFEQSYDATKLIQQHIKTGGNIKGKDFVGKAAKRMKSKDKKRGSRFDLPDKYYKEIVENAIRIHST